MAIQKRNNTGLWTTGVYTPYNDGRSKFDYIPDILLAVVTSKELFFNKGVDEQLVRHHRADKIH